MIFIHNEHHTDPHLNLALEEYALRNFDQDYDYLLFYINDPSIIIGRNQNTLEEINHEYVEQNKINVVRRFPVVERFTTIPEILTSVLLQIMTKRV